MKRKLLLLIMVLACLALVAGILVACNPTGKELTFYDKFENGKVYYIITTNGDEQLSLPADPVREGYDFLGWYVENGSNSFRRTSYKAFDISQYSAEKDLDVFARWQSVNAAERQYMVTYYDAAGNFIESDLKNSGDKLSLPDIDASVPSGQTFVGWKEAATGKIRDHASADGVGADIDFVPVSVDGEPSAQLTVKNADLTFAADVARFDISEIVSVSEEWARYEIKMNNKTVGTSAAPVVDLQYGTNAFDLYIYYESNGSHHYLRNSKKETIFVTREVGECEVVFNYTNADNGSEYTAYSDGTGSITEPSGLDLEKTGYLFAGWQLKKGSDSYFWDFAADVLTIDLYDSFAADGKITLYACYEPIPYYVAEFTVGDYDDVTIYGSDTKELIKFEEQMVMPAASKNYYDFKGWQTGDKLLTVGTDLEAAFGSAFYYTVDTWAKTVGILTGDVTFTPVFKPTEYKITYESNGGTNNKSNPSTYTIESSTIELKAPTRTGYTFEGWYDDSGNAVTEIPKGSFGDITLTAKWEPIKYSITYNLGGGTNNKSNPSTYTIESSAIELKAPTRTGYTFEGWYKNKDFTGDPVTEIPAGSTGNITLYAKWGNGNM